VNIKRAAIIGASGGAVAVWLAAASTSVRPAPPFDGFKRTSTDEKVEKLDAEIKRLHERLHPSAAPLQNRDLFRYTERRRLEADPPRSRPSIADALAAGAASAEIARPPLVVIGLAEDDGARTAILSAPGDLLFVKEGDLVESRFRVTHISSNGVELTDTDGSVLQLHLK
jgi:hypothetical protein